MTLIKCCMDCNFDVSSTDAVNLVPEEYASKCIHGGSKYSDLTVIPSLNSSNPCEVCYCWVRTTYMYSISMQ